ncbi:MAG: pirin family protein [Burkholderiales bacterium]
MKNSPFTLLKSHAKDLGGFQVRRLLPGHPIRMVGPFIFFDHMGPAVFPAGAGVDVRPHPHIGLATVTYLFEGAMMHRDSLGSVQRITPGDVNWMTAGRGIVHSERSPDDERAAGARLHGIQTWVALPQAHEDTEPAFSHHAKDTLPVIERPGVHMRLIAGSAFGKRAPVATFSEMLYLAIDLAAGAALALPPKHEERGVYVVEGDVRVAGHPLAALHLGVLAGGETVEIAAVSKARLIVLGGEKMDSERIIWWNFVASTTGRIEAAKLRWARQEFPTVPGETEFIPLPA